MANITANIYESANGWVSTLINKAIESIPYDKTIQCRIEDDTMSAEGRYLVSYNSVKFYAITDNNKIYKNKDTVYVLVPQGDFNSQKIILCKNY